jgi:multimeric flavodoxin WrbA
MKVLIIYFSFSGNNRLLAEHLATRLDCDICPIVEKRRRTAVTIMLDMIFRREPKLQPLKYSALDYDHIILVAPIWDAKLSTPMKALIKREKSALSNYSFISLCGYERAEQKENITQELLTLSGHSPRAVCELRLCDLFPAEKRNDVTTISRYHATSDDLIQFESQIAAFLKLISS